MATEITPLDLQDRLAAAAPPLVVDVREAWEVEICRIDGATIIPMRSLPQRLQEIPKDRTVVVLCHSGMRSYMVADWLAQQGYDAVSVAGGIDRWSIEVDPNVARY